VNTLVKIEGYLIPDARMIVTHAQWRTLWTQPATWPEAKALRKGIARLETWRKLLTLGSSDGIVRAALVSSNGVRCLCAHAPGHATAGETESKTHEEARPAWTAIVQKMNGSDVLTEERPAPPPPRPWQLGDVVTSKRGEIVEWISGITPGEHCELAGFALHSLYLGKQFVIDVVVPNLDGYRLATPADHETAKAYAKRFQDDDGEGPSSSLGSAGGKPASSGKTRTGRGARSQPGKRSSSQVSQVAILETQNGSEREQISHDIPSNSASTKPPSLLASASAFSSAPITSASESRTPKPKKRRIPPDQVS